MPVCWVTFIDHLRQAIGKWLFFSLFWCRTVHGIWTKKNNIVSEFRLQRNKWIRPILLISSTFYSWNANRLAHTFYKFFRFWFSILSYWTYEIGDMIFVDASIDDVSQGFSRSMHELRCQLNISPTARLPPPIIRNNVRNIFRPWLDICADFYQPFVRAQPLLEVKIKNVRYRLNYSNYCNILDIQTCAFEIAWRRKIEETEKCIRINTWLKKMSLDNYDFEYSQKKTSAHYTYCIEYEWDTDKDWAWSPRCFAFHPRCADTWAYSMSSSYTAWPASINLRMNSAKHRWDHSQSLSGEIET